jgi:hypothetical protein
MHPLLRALLSVCLIGGLWAQTAKKYKNQGEYDIYDAVTKDMIARNFTKALADLDTWRKNYPDSDYKDERQLLYVQAYASAKQPGKAIDASQELMARQGLDTASTIKLLFTAATAIQQVPSPTVQELSIAGGAARRLQAFDTKPENVSADAWAQALPQLLAAAKDALLYIALLPGVQAMQANNCGTAEAAFTKALEDRPDSSRAAYELGRAQLCLYKTQPDKASPAIYAFARAAALDPANEAFLEKLFDQYHGRDPEALRQIKEAAAKAPFPPAGFHIQSVADIANEKEAEFEKSNPQLALWMKIKAALAAEDGEQYYASNLAGTEVTQLRGVLLEAKPACRPKELLVAVPLPDAPQPLQPEIALKLDKPLTGKPEIQTEFHWIGAPSAFTKTPFLLTMDVEAGKIEGLKTTPCASAPGERPPVKKP